MPTMPRTHRPIGSATDEERNRQRYERRDKALASMYGIAWSRVRHVYLIEHPLCRYCERIGRLTPANVVDHIRPHRGNADLFWNPDNWQPLCQPCHDSIKQREDRNK